MACDMEVEIIGRNCMEITDSISQMSYNKCFSQRGSLYQPPVMAEASWKNFGRRETFNNNNGFRPELIGVAGGKRKYEREMGHQYTSAAGSYTDCNSLTDNRGPVKKRRCCNRSPEMQMPHNHIMDEIQAMQLTEHKSTAMAVCSNSQQRCHRCQAGEGGHLGHLGS